MSTIEETLLGQFEIYNATRPASARLARYRAWIAERIAEGGYDLEALAWADVQCRVATAALESGDIDGLLEAFDRMRNALIDAGVPKLIEHNDNERRSKGVKTSAENRRDKPPPAWITEAFDRAYALAESDGYASPGRAIIEKYAWSMAGPKHRDRHQLTEHRARQYLENRRKPPAEN